MTQKKHIHELRGLTFAEFGALLGVRTLLAQGHMVYNPNEDNVGDNDHVFNMSYSNYKPFYMECGSVQCIGGAMAKILGHDPDDYVEEHREDENLGVLFFPPDTYDYASISPKQAIKAIDNFIRFGKPKWKDILRKNQLNAYATSIY